MNQNIPYPELSTRLLKPAEVSACLNISKTATYHLLATGQIPSVKLGRIVRVRPEDLRLFIEKNIHNQNDCP